MSAFFELVAESTGDASRIAKPAGHDPDFLFDLRRAGPIIDAPELRWTWTSENPLPDWPFTTDGIRLVSTSLRTVLEKHLGPRDRIQWLAGSVTITDGTSHPYWVPHFPERPDAYHQALSTWGSNGLPIRWVLDPAKLDGHAVFALPKDVLSIIVARDVAEEIRSIGLTGVEIRPARSA